MRRAPVLRPVQAREELSRAFSSDRFWAKLARTALVAGRQVVERALWLYYAAERPEVPRWAKLTIYGALAYFVLPLDAIPDIIPGAGYVDDLGALTTALLTVASYVNDDVRQRARARMHDWFGPPAQED
jgi:uncharacterized membrane protein YkvA (DUF1232 family)